MILGEGYGASLVTKFTYFILFFQFLFHSCNICLQWSNVLITW